jgi:hypothetical protein
MLTGVFNESRYLQARIRQEFGVPIHPIIAIGVQFGLQEEKVMNCVLKRTYDITNFLIYLDAYRIL